MPEENGTSRLDRIERILDMFIADHERIRQEHQESLQSHRDFHEEFDRDLKQLLIAQVLQADEIDKLWKTVQEQSKQIAEHTKHLELQRENGKDLDRRINDLVSATGEFIRSRPNTIQ
jgi:hypothetical protein